MDSCFLSAVHTKTEALRPHSAFIPSAPLNAVVVRNEIQQKGRILEAGELHLLCQY